MPFDRLMALSERSESKRDFDLLIRGGSVVDGSESAKALRADVAVRGDTIADVGPGGLFLAHEHTLARFRTDLFMSPLFRSQAYPTWVKQGSRTADVVATDEWKRLLESYEDPGIDSGIDAELRDFVDRRAYELDQ